MDGLFKSDIGVSKISRTIAFVFVFVFASYFVPSQAQTNIDGSVDAQRQLEIQRREAQQREQDIAAPTVHSELPTVTTRLPTEGEIPCAQVARMQLDGSSADQFHWLMPFFDAFANRCLGSKSLQALQDNLNDGLKGAGFVTSHVNLVDQAIQDAAVHFSLTAGRIGQFKLLDPAISQEGATTTEPRSITNWPNTTAWQMAMPAKPGDLLNIRDLDQAAETMQRLGYAVEQYITPQRNTLPHSDVVHDIVIAWSIPKKTWQASMSMDNSSSPAFGRTQMASQVSFVNLMGLADQLFLSASGNAEPASIDRKLRSEYVNFTMPWGYHQLSLSHSRSSSRMGIKGSVVDFTSFRFDQETQIKYAYTLYRDGHFKVTPELTIEYRTGNSHIDEAELAIQRRNAQVNSLALNVNLIAAGQQIQTTFSVSQTHRRLQEDDDTDGFFNDEAKYATSKRWTGQWVKSTSILDEPVLYTMQWDVLSTKRPTPLSSSISMGGRWSVRGFSGDTTLSASDGMWIRNEWRLQKTKTAWLLGEVIPYGGLDIGKTWGGTAPEGPQRFRWLAGAVLGLKSQWGSESIRCSIDFALSTPLHDFKQNSSLRQRLVPYLALNIAF